MSHLFLCVYLCYVGGKKIKVDLVFQGSESMDQPQEEDCGPLFLTVHLTGIGRSRERGLQSGGFAPSMRVMPSQQGLQLKACHSYTTHFQTVLDNKLSC